MGKDIIKSGTYKSIGHQRYYCKHCETYFMETKGTPLYRKHLSEREIINIYKHLVEKNGMRSIERITGHHRDTIGRLLDDMAEHEVKNIRLTAFECDEIWRFVLKKRKRLILTARGGLKNAIQGFTHV